MTSLSDEQLEAIRQQHGDRSAVQHRGTASRAHGRCAARNRRPINQEPIGYTFDGPTENGETT